MLAPPPDRRRKASVFPQLILGAAVCLLVSSCGDSATAVANRILDRHRRAAKVKPLPASGLVILNLSSLAGGPEAPTGVSEIAWEGERYRERVTSAGVTAERGIQGGKAFLTDEDGVTRVGSEPMLSELITRWYFWRRAYLFDDRERARPRLGPADDRTVSVDLHPLGGNPLRLKFDRSTAALVAVLSPRFHLEFNGPGRFRDSSRPRLAVAGEVAWFGLPTGTLPDAQVGGTQASFPPSPGAPVDPGEVAPVLGARVNGVAARLRLDAAVDGPLRLGPALASRLALPYRKDVFGRELARGVRLELPGLTLPAVTVEKSTAIAGAADAEAGGSIFREAVVELDPREQRMRFHDPEKWVAPANLARLIIDDDGNRPVATLTRSGEQIRLALGAETGGPVLLLAPASARRCGISGPSSGVEGFRWGVLELLPLSVGIDPDAFAPDWGDDGRLSWELLRRYHFYEDMPHRWIYLTPPPGAGIRPRK